MIYTRNKNCFKKTTIKTQHRQAQKNILNLIKESLEKDSSKPQNSIEDENQCKNVQSKDNIISKISPSSLFHIQKPIYQSIYSSIDRRQAKIRNQMTINHVLDYTIKDSQNLSNVHKIQKQYIQMLQAKLIQLQHNIQQLKQRNNNQIQKQAQKSNHKNYSESNLQQLIRFYHKARNIIIVQSVELLECKGLILSQIQQNQTRIKGINSALSKGQELLEIYKLNNVQLSVYKNTIKQEIQADDLKELKDICCFQAKTIQFLKKQRPFDPQFNQIKLLRYQINRVCNQNERLLLLVDQKSKPESNRIQKKDPFSNLSYQLERASIKILELNEKIKQIEQNYENEKQKNFKLKQEKQFLGQCLDKAKTKTDELQKTINTNQKNIYELKRAYIKQSPVQQLRLQENETATTQQLFKQLKSYPKYFNLLMSVINQYEFKINELQNWVCNQRQAKQKYIRWSKQVYHLLESAQVPQHIMNQHKQQLYAMERKAQDSKIQKLLRQIQTFSIGISDKDIKQMQEQLQQYIMSLSTRNQVIKQQQFQDGSSVVFSQRPNDQDFL